MADKALLLGINDYASIGDLRGCQNDVANIETLLVDVYGFPAGNVETLLGDQVVRTNIRAKSRWLLEGVGPGDRVVLHFSGHGSHIKNTGDDIELDDEDELICLYDMDWSDENSYLLDDDLGRFARSVPEGVRLTIILDSCHSGDGTRLLGKTRRLRTPSVIVEDTELRSGVKERELERLKGEPESQVRNRFVEAPSSFRSRRDQPEVHKFGGSLNHVELNHQLLAGTREDGTSADAFIDGNFNGAFTFYLCESARELGANANTKMIMDRVLYRLRQGNFSQVPQLEGLGSDEPLFGSRCYGDGGGGATGGAAVVRPSPEGPTPLSASAVTQSNGTALISQMLRVSEKFIDLSNRILDGTGNPGSIGQHDRLPTETVVYVHGISRHLAGFSKPWWDAMQPHLTRTMDRREVVWSDIVNPRHVAVSQRDVSPEGTRTREQIEMILEDRLKQVSPTDSHQRSARDTLRSSGFAIDDFVRYMLNSAERKLIQQRFDNVVRPLLEAGSTVQIISHSWGTVVAWEVMRNLDSLTFPGRVENLFVVGSALSIGPVQANLKQRISNGDKPTHVSRIINLDAGGDIVGGPIADVFDIDEESLGLEPVGCTQIPFTDIALNPRCAHSSYFEKDNSAVNRDIFAKFIK